MPTLFVVVVYLYWFAALVLSVHKCSVHFVNDFQSNVTNNNEACKLGVEDKI